MPSRIDFPLKRVSETLKYNSSFTGLITFSDSMTSSDTISTVAANVTVFSGTDASPNALVSAVAISGQQVSPTFVGGVAGTTYSVVLKATTSAGQILERQGFITVINDN